MSKCPDCEKQVKNWEGSDPVCGWYDGGVFSDNNFMCAGLNKVIDKHKDKCVLSGNEKLYVIPLPEDCSYDYLLISQYESRGSIQSVRLVTDGVYDQVTLHAWMYVLRRLGLGGEINE